MLQSDLQFATAVESVFSAAMRRGEADTNHQGSLVQKGAQLCCICFWLLLPVACTN